MNYQGDHEMKNMNYLIHHVLYHIFKIILSIPLKHGKDFINPLLQRYIDKIKNTVTFKIKTAHYIEFLTQ